MVEQGGMLDTVLEHVVRVTMDEEGEEMGWNSERWRDESVPSVRCVPGAGCSWSCTTQQRGAICMQKTGRESS